MTMAEVFISILLKMLSKFLGEEFICKIAVIIMEIWGKTTKNTWDEKVFLAMANALGVDSAVLKKLVEEAEKQNPPA